METLSHLQADIWSGAAFRDLDASTEMMQPPAVRVYA
jgi:hypothetical protein